MRKKLIIMALLAAQLPTLANAQCRMAVAGASCVVVPQTSVTPPAVEIGEILERGTYSILMNSRYYGLPAVKDGWVYMRIEDDIYRVDWRTHEVLEKVTDQANRNW